MATYRTENMGGVRWAVEARATGDPGEAADALLREVPGAIVDTSDEALVEALLARGARPRRRAHDMEYDVAAGLPELADPDGYAFAPVTAAAPLVPVHLAAFAEGHVDHRPGMDVAAELDKLLRGEQLGPFLPTASWQATRDGEVAGAVLAVDRPAFGSMTARAWIVDLFVHPEHQGRRLGGALVRRAVAGAGAAGHSHVGLVVTDGNPAIRTYLGVGFVVTLSGTTVVLP